MDCVERSRNLLLNDPRIGAKVMKTKYPQGGGADDDRGGYGEGDQFFPASCGCRLYRGQCGDGSGQFTGLSLRGEPMLEKTVTVTGDGIQEPGNFKVPLGTDFAGIIEAAGGLKGSPEKIIAGTRRPREMRCLICTFR